MENQNNWASPGPSTSSWNPGDLPPPQLVLPPIPGPSPLRSSSPQGSGGQSLLRPARPSAPGPSLLRSPVPQTYNKCVIIRPFGLSAPGPSTLHSSSPRGSGGRSLLRRARPSAPGPSTLHSSSPRGSRGRSLLRPARPSAPGPSTLHSSSPRGSRGRSLLRPARPSAPGPSLLRSPVPQTYSKCVIIRPYHRSAPGPFVLHSSSPQGSGGRSLLRPARPSAPGHSTPDSPTPIGSQPRRPGRSSAPVPSVRGVLAHKFSGRPPRRAVQTPRLSPLEQPDIIRRVNTITFHKAFGSHGNRGEVVWNRGPPALPPSPPLQEHSPTATDPGGSSCELPLHQAEPATTDSSAAFADNSELSVSLTKNKAELYIVDEDKAIQPKEGAPKLQTIAKKRKVYGNHYEYNPQKVTKDDFTTLDHENDEDGFIEHRPIDVQYCTVCRRFIRDPHDLYEHMNNVHKSFICLYCLKIFLMNHELLEHFQAVHQKYANPNLSRREVTQVSQATEAFGIPPRPSHELSLAEEATTSTNSLPTFDGDSRDDQVSNEIENTGNRNEDDSSSGGYRGELLERIIEILKNRANQGDTDDADENTEQEENVSQSETEREENVLRSETKQEENVSQSETGQEENLSRSETEQEENLSRSETEQEENVSRSETEQEENVSRSETEQEENVSRSETKQEENVSQSETEKEENVSQSDTEGINMTSPSNNSTGQVISNTNNDVSSKITYSKNDQNELKMDTNDNRQPKKNVFVCNICNIYVVESYNLFKHFREVHSQYICLHCLQSYKDATSLAGHLKVAHHSKTIKTVNVQSWEGFIRNFEGPVSVMCSTCEAFVEFDN